MIPYVVHDLQIDLNFVQHLFQDGGVLHKERFGPLLKLPIHETVKETHILFR